MRLNFAIVRAAMAALMFSMSATADAQEAFPAKVVPVSGAPVTLTTCTATKYASGITGTTNVTNASDVFLTSFIVRFTVYDHGGTVIGQTDYPEKFDSNLAPGDSALKTFGGDALKAPVSSAATSTCRIQSAHFEGGKVWQYGRQWTGKIAQPSTTPN